MADEKDDEKDIIETIKEEVADAAKAVVAEVKAVAVEVADAVAEGAADLYRQVEGSVEHDRPKKSAGEASASEKPADGNDRQT